MEDEGLEIAEFVRKLHSQEIIIDPKGNDIPYVQGKTLSTALTQALENWQADAVLGSPPSPATSYAFSVIAACYAHGIVSTKESLMKKMKKTEKLLDQFASENSTLQSQNKDLKRKLTELEENKKLKKS